MALAPTEIPAPAIAPTQFLWHPATRGYERGELASSDSALGQLRIAMQSGKGFAVAQEGLGPMLPPGILQCQTGGTTGTPKLIERNHSSWISSFIQNAHHFGIGPGTAVGCFGGLGHSLALYAAIEAAHMGADIHMLVGLRPRAQIAELSRHNVSVLYATPTQLSLLTTVQATLPAVRHVLCGGGQLGAEARNKVHILCPSAEITVFYGASETSFVSLSDAHTPPGSVGRAYGTARIEIRNGGEVWVSSPYLFSHYASGHSVETRRDGAFLTVGEMGWLDKDGYLFLTGRRDRMVRIAEQSVHPETVEARLLTDPDVAMACVLPRDDAARGQVLEAVIASAPNPTLADRLDRDCRIAFGPLIAPRAFHFLPELPLRAAGKPDLARLAAWLDSLA
ncbi:AMP-binding protein [Roseovarius pelagicus]|uniref:AMP-binding protein n=1 Tax=Roseovarius pelagicus TaxID=2980108 RepID=A0ABY6D7V6_9RHOB|nr:AMP-binding protein [Roseovarius pelagicus]UXX82178.1 AMP-binding protein [Roseovarius pelagicus]